MSQPIQVLKTTVLAVAASNVRVALHGGEVWVPWTGSQPSTGDEVRVLQLSAGGFVALPVADTPAAYIGSWCEVYQNVSGADKEVTATFSTFNVVRPGGWTIANGAVRAPWTGNYMMVNRFRVTPAQIQIWVGHGGYPNPVLNMWDGGGSEQWMTYTYMLRLAVGAAVPRPMMYAAGGNAWNADLIQSVTFMGDV